VVGGGPIGQSQKFQFGDAENFRCSLRLGFTNGPGFFARQPFQAKFAGGEKNRRHAIATGFFQRLYAPEPVQPLMLCTSLAFHAAINLPLLVLSFYISLLAPLVAFTSCVSLGTCALAATQANLPRQKKRFWSRPLVAVLFFLQPIVRGWARFKWRLSLLSTRKQSPFEPAAGAEVPERVGYWSPRSTNRLRFVSEILAKLEQRGWTYKTDTGWSTYDVETPAHLWTELRLTSVSEELAGGKLLLHCRIESRWTLPAKLIAAAIFIAVFCVVALFAKEIPWTWMLLTVLPLVCWILDDERLEQARALAAIIDSTAKDQSLTRLIP
jgi:hypothetical protein